jgi:hypothetical protein
LLRAVAPESSCVPISWIPVSLQLNTSFHTLSFPTFALWSAVATNMILKADIRKYSQAIHLIQYFMKKEQSSPLFSRIGLYGEDLDLKSRKWQGAERNCTVESFMIIAQ